MTQALDLPVLGGAASGAPAVAHPDSGLCYGELRSAVASCRGALALPAKALVLIDEPRGVSGLLGYLAALSAGHAVILAEDARAPWELVTAYHPELLVTDPGRDLAELARRSGYRQRASDPLPLWHRESPADTAPIHPDLALLARTSGSVGLAKTVRLSFDNLRTNATAIAEALALRPADRVMTSLPLDFSFGLSLVNSAFAAGASITLTTYPVSSWPFWEYLDHTGGTCAGAVPATYVFLRGSRWDPAAHRSLRLLLHAGGALDETTQAYLAGRMAAAGGEFVSMYGQTEATARISYLPAALALAHRGSVGVAIPGGRISIDRPGSGPAAEGEVGEIVYAGPGVMMGYATTRADLANPDQCGTVLRTGDLGYLRGGLLYITGRMDRQVKILGRRINLDQVESQLSAWGLTAAVEAAGDHDQRLVVVAEPAADLTEACRALGRMLGLPSGWVRPEPVSGLPRNGRGKIDRLAVRHALRLPAAAPAGGGG